MTRPWELRLHARWWTRALLGFGLSGLVLDSLLAWLVYATFAASPYVSLPPSDRMALWVLYWISPASGPPALAPLGLHPLELLFTSLTLAAAMGIAYATLRARFDPEPMDETTGVRARRVAVQVASFLLPLLPIVVLGIVFVRSLSILPR